LLAVALILMIPVFPLILLSLLLLVYSAKRDRDVRIVATLGLAYSLTLYIIALIGYSSLSLQFARYGLQTLLMCTSIYLFILDALTSYGTTTTELDVGLFGTFPLFLLIVLSLPLLVMKGRDRDVRIVATFGLVYPIIALSLLSSHLAKYGMLWMYASVYVYILSALTLLCMRHMIMKKQLLEPRR